MSTERINGNNTATGDSPILLEDLISLTPTRIRQAESPVFTIALAHEIRNPLTNINLAIDLMQEDISSEQRQIFLDILTRSSARINDIIVKLLANYEVKEVSLEIIQVSRLLDEVLSLIGDRIILKNIHVQKKYTRQDSQILINKQQVMIALINIIINAIDAMPAQRPELKLTTRMIKGTCIIEIEDNGCGISKKNLKNIFKPYFTDKPGGMGLGLSTALTTLLSNHARVKVHSEEGKGTSFILFFERISAISDTLDNS